MLVRDKQMGWKLVRPSKVQQERMWGTDGLGVLEAAVGWLPFAFPSGFLSMLTHLNG